jgi:hypothetical protein
MMECCCVDDGDFERASLERAEIRRARKAYVCGECDEEISRGERYEYYSGVWEGAWVHYRTCLPCIGIRRDFFPCGYVWGQMREDFRECQGWDYVTGDEDDI